MYILYALFTRTRTRLPSVRRVAGDDAAAASVPCFEAGPVGDSIFVAVAVVVVTPGAVSVGFDIT
jgi:hypothetical protein